MSKPYLTCYACDREFEADDEEPHPSCNEDIRGRLRLTCPCGNAFLECIICGGFVQPEMDVDVDIVAEHTTHETCAENVDEDTIDTLEQLGVTPVPDEFLNELKTRV